MSTQLNEKPRQQLVTLAEIERAKEGLAAARDRKVQKAIQQTLDKIKAISKGKREDRVSGWLRRCLLRAFIHCFFRVRVEYPERIPQKSALLAPNHLSHIDPLLLLSEVPSQPYYYIPGDARTLYNQWWKRKILQFAGGVIPLERRWKEEIAVIEEAEAGCLELADLAAAIQQDVPTGKSIQTLRLINQAVQEIFARGDGIIIFPEGKLGSVEGKLKLPLSRGAVIYALRAGVPIVPVVLIGTHDLYFRKELTIRFGEALHFPQSHRPKPGEVDLALQALQEALTALLPQDYQDKPTAKPLNYFLNHMFW